MKTGALILAGMALVMGACGSKDAPEDITPGAGTSRTPAAGQMRASENAVTAVLESQGTPVARLSFELVARPVAGQPYALKLLASATQPVPALRYSIDPQGLTVVPESGVLELAAAEAPVAIELMVTAAKAGLVDLRVRLAVAEGDAETVYAIPMLVAEAQ